MQYIYFKSHKYHFQVLSRDSIMCKKHANGKFFNAIENILGLTHPADVTRTSVARIY